MAEEICLADLETAQKNFVQKLSAHVMKREAFELKFQEEITSMAANINGKLDNLIKSLDSIQLQLFNFGKGKVVDDVGKLGPIAGGLSGPVLEEFGNKPNQLTNNSLQIEEICEGNLKAVSQEHDINCIVLSDPLLSDKGLDKFATLSPLNIKKNDDSTSECLCLEALKRRDGIGIPFSTKKETKCKFSQSSLKIVVHFFNSAEKWGSNTTACSVIHLGENVGPNSSYSPKLCLNGGVAERGIPIKRHIKKKINIGFVVDFHLDFAKSTTTEHLTYKLGGTDKRFIERFKKEVARMNQRSFKYRKKFDKYKVECGPIVTIDVSLLILKLSNGLEANVYHDGQAHEHAFLAFGLGEKQMICCLNKMGATIPSYPKQIKRLTDTLMGCMIATSFPAQRVVLVLDFECQGIMACVKIGTRRKMVIFSFKVQELAGCHPFESPPVVDVLFLHGNLKLVVAKQAALHFLFDWQSDDVDDFVVRFCIMRLESFVFYLLDNPINETLEEACLQLPEIAGLYIYRKVAQALLEKQNLANLMALQLRRDGVAARLVALGKIVNIVQVRVECEVQTGAFRHQRFICTTVMVKELKGVCLIVQVISIPETCCFCNKKSLEEEEFKEFAPYLNKDYFYRWLSYASEESTLFQG